MLMCESKNLMTSMTSMKKFSTDMTNAGSTHIWVVTTSTVSRGLFIARIPLHRTYVRLARSMIRARLLKN